MPNVRPSNVAPVLAIPPGLVDLATRLAEDMPARIGAQVNPSRVIVRSFLHHVNGAAKAEKRRVANKARGWERAEMRAMADKAGHDKAASDLLPLVQQVIDARNAEIGGALASEMSNGGGNPEIAAAVRAMIGAFDRMARESAVAGVTNVYNEFAMEIDRRDGEGGEVG